MVEIEKQNITGPLFKHCSSLRFYLKSPHMRQRQRETEHEWGRTKKGGLETIASFKNTYEWINILHFHCLWTWSDNHAMSRDLITNPLENLFLKEKNVSGYSWLNKRHLFPVSLFQKSAATLNGIIDELCYPEKVYFSQLWEMLKTSVSNMRLKTFYIVFHISSRLCYYGVAQD